jgi:hypothetical protein
MVWDYASALIEGDVVKQHLFFVSLALTSFSAHERSEVYSHCRRARLTPVVSSADGLVISSKKSRSKPPDGDETILDV